MSYLWLVLLIAIGLEFGTNEAKGISSQPKRDAVFPKKSDFRKKDLKRFRKIAGTPPPPSPNHTDDLIEKDHQPDRCYDLLMFCWFWRLIYNCNGAYYAAMHQYCRRTCYFCG